MSKCIIITGKELGEYKDIKELRKLAREEYRKLQQIRVCHSELGEIRFSAEGFKKILATGADERKYKLIPKLEEIIKTAKYINQASGSKPDIIASHWLENKVELEGVILCIGIQILQDRFGKKFYNINQDLDQWNKKYPSVLPVESSTGSEGYINNITDFEVDFNHV